MAKLYVVPTPIGNLEDMTFRAVRILSEVDLILAEDTRTSHVLLSHYNIKTKTSAHHKFNEHAQVEKIAQDILDGKNVALISDAGTPGISDPGYLLVHTCVLKNITIETLPGPTAFVPALVNSGFPTDEFVFMGFLPVKKGRMTKFKSIAEELRTIVIYESPYRIIKTLEQLNIYCSDRTISISRELSKKFEETLRGTPEQLLQHFSQHEPRGEFVLIIAAKK
ncbi:MAG TPA: 16S rRNA (cytidine(1402)-2'-O)-methyltransferase [Chitinophagales bacterium]|nr:16S rRNA (cytidine(1402)-2'-O)-methyltransferase [Chitinophagales bacterium]HRG27636.1 16S rRNA (cytidine(1402)-2'-O)-methyltransferase [Chitinophagales bacterium]HRG87256.1 16S rRNA (cytidine(1402)-2'-O)-methyltransferase [Chitinophagales bacterium]HRH54322.1 16S rRNA (cytidine(1402)-2'-O)-methyltransferase [Chitinophagales bacterium]